MRTKLFVWSGIGLVLLVVSVTVSLSIGSAQLPFSQVWRIVLHQIPLLGMWVEADWPDSAQRIVLQVRLPRIALAVLVGGALSVAGAGFQGILRNPLADPYTLGVASGAAVGASFLLLFGLNYALFGQWTIPVVAFMTALLSLAAVIRLARVQGKFQIQTVILAGVVMQAFLGSVVSFMAAMSRDAVNEIVFWLMGSLQMKGWSYSAVMFPYVLVGTGILLFYGRALNLFALGERQAAHLGVGVERTKYIVLSVATLITAAAVSVSGIIGFVGLITPHLMRLIVGPDYRLLLPLSALFGGIYVLWADTMARTVLSPTEIPLGVVTAFLGAPFFAYLLRKHKKATTGSLI